MPHSWQHPIACLSCALSIQSINLLYSPEYEAECPFAAAHLSYFRPSRSKCCLLHSIPGPAKAAADTLTCCTHSHCQLIAIQVHVVLEFSHRSYFPNERYHDK